MDSESIGVATVSRPLSSSSAGKIFPPGFRFHPTDEELILYYLKRRICGRSLILDIIREIDVYKWEPEELPGLSIWKTGDRQWFFFSPRNRKYPNGGKRLNRVTAHGFWKATGKDHSITCNNRSVGIRKTLIYHEGRAPSGKRTDWVMHEYTLDEEELKRCRHVYEIYALCKVFKKSGLGPKNGEQYGARFVEEEWADEDEDEDYLDVEALFVQNVNQVHPIPTENTEPGLEITIAGEPELVQPMAQTFPVVGQEASTETHYFGEKMAAGPSYEAFDLQPGSELTQLVYDGSEVSSLPNIPPVELQPLVINEEFLEMADLIGPQPDVQNSQLLTKDLAFPELDGLHEFDLWTHVQINTDFTALQETVDAGYDLWMHDQTSNDFVAAETTDMAVSNRSPGVVVDENPGNSESHVNQSLISKEDDGSESWFSSALWAFVESIPTTPASASESSVCVQRVLERMSSGNTAATGVVGSRRLQKSSRSSWGIVYFSVLGVLFSILFAFFRSSIPLLKRCIS